ncbi:MAG: hypothetical protein SFW08_08710, partial [Gemmatimonadaceae bacterium]|nr:hypothetical protein [Gemmatimonadaceae bacterium]
MRHLILLVAAAAAVACADAPAGPDRPDGPPAPDRCLGKGTRIDLAVGQSQRLATTDTLCLQLPGGDREYVLAAYDPRDVDRNRMAWVPTPLPPAQVTIAERTDRPTARRAPDGPSVAVRVPGAPDVAMTNTAPPAPCRDDEFLQSQFWCRSKPWTLGEQFVVRSSASPTGTATATITMISADGRYVVAEVPGGDAADTQLFRESLRLAFPLAMEHAIPLYRRLFGREPLTSTGSGQMLLLYGPYAHGRVAGGCCFGDVGLSHYVVLGVGLRRPPNEMVQLLAHEYAHVWALRWFYETRPTGGSPFDGQVWAGEGVADLLSFDVMRRLASLPFAANLTSAQLEAGAAVARPWTMELNATGDLFAGYHETSSFFRHLVYRLVSRGLSVEAALGMVARHAHEGWFGIDMQGRQRTGLAVALETALGAPWEPGAAVLDWMLAQGADDLTTDPQLQNPFFRDVSTLIGGGLRIGVSTGRDRLQLSLPFAGASAVRLVDRIGGATFVA